MRIITVNIPVSYINAIKKLTGENGIYPSRSELIRVACREFLINELEAAKSFAKFQSKSELSKFYLPPVDIESKSKTVKIPLGINAQGITEFKTYTIVER